MGISRVKTWSSGEVLTASDLNAEFNNVLNNGSDLVSPFTKAISMGGFALNFDAANTIAATGTTSGIAITGGTIREPVEDSITAFATGGQSSATALSVAKKYHRISVCATAADSVKLPTATAGQAHYIRNDGVASAQVFGTSPDTINGVGTTVGVPLAVGMGAWYVCTTAGAWTSTIGVTLGPNTFLGAQTLNSTSALNESKTTVASASSPDIWTSIGNVVDYTGTVTATGFAAAPQAGVRRTLVCAAAAPFTAGANVLIQGFASGSTFTAAAGDQIDVVAITTTQFRLTIRSNAGTPVVGTSIPRGYIDGLVMSAAGSSATLTVAAGQATDSTNADVMTLASALAKTTSAWAVGTRNGGLDTGSITTTTWYHFYEIKRVDTQVVDVLFSLSATAPTMPTNYTLKRLIGSAKTDGSSQWVAFTQIGDHFRWVTKVTDLTAANTGNTATTRTLASVPSGRIVRPDGLIQIVSGITANAAVVFSSLTEVDAGANFTYNSAVVVLGSTQSTLIPMTSIYTNTSAQVRSRESNTDSQIFFITLGWFDQRGKNS